MSASPALQASQEGRYWLAWVEWGMPVHLASYYAIHAASAVAAAPVVAVANTPASPEYWYELLKAFGPPIVTGLFVLRGLVITFDKNNELKKREILYKEQLDAVKSILKECDELVELVRRELLSLNNYEEFNTKLQDYLNRYRYIYALQLPLLKPKSRYAVGIFNMMIRKLTF